MWGLFIFAPFMAAHVEPWLSDHLGNKAVIGGLSIGFAGILGYTLKDTVEHDHEGSELVDLNT